MTSPAMPSSCDEQTPSPPIPRRGRLGAAFWFVVGSGAATLIATAPGQTAGVSAFIDPMIAGLGIERPAISTAYLVGTLFGAAVLPLIGRAVDRFGALRSTSVIAVFYLAAVFGMSRVTGAATLTLGFMGLRSMGQGALGLVAVTVVSRQAAPRVRGRALGLVSAIGGAGMSLAPIGIDAAVEHVGWRNAWQLSAVAVLLLIVPVLVVTGRRRSVVVRGRDGADTMHHDEPSLTAADAVREPWFWVLATSVGLSGMLITAVTFHQFDLLGRQGLSSAQVAASFLPNAIAALIATLLAGHLVDRCAPRVLVASGMVLHTLGFSLALTAGAGWTVVLYAVAVGAAGGFLRTVEAATLVSLFGPAHLGSLRGIVSAVAVGGTALGPVAYSLVESGTGSYAPALVTSAVLPLGVGVWALHARRPALLPAGSDR